MYKYVVVAKPSDVKVTNQFVDKVKDENGRFNDNRKISIINMSNFENDLSKIPEEKWVNNYTKILYNELIKNYVQRLPYYYFLTLNPDKDVETRLKAKQPISINSKDDLNKIPNENWDNNFIYISSKSDPISGKFVFRSVKQALEDPNRPGIAIMPQYIFGVKKSNKRKLKTKSKEKSKNKSKPKHKPKSKPKRKSNSKKN